MRISVLVLSFLSLTTLCAGPYREDLDFIRTTLLENHPGVYNTLDPHFVPHLEEAYQQACDLLSVEDSTDPLIAFGKSFQDSHLKVQYFIMNQIRLYPKLYEMQYWANGDAYYLKMPTFEHSFEETQKSFELVLTHIEQIDCNDKVLVLDLRGNTGGNSQNGQNILQAFFGAEFVQNQVAKANQHVYVDWRASKGNIEFLQEYSNSLDRSWLDPIIQGMQQSLSQNKPYFKESFPPYLIREISPKALPKAIAVLIDEKNNSAALDFIDDLKALEIPCVLIGQPTQVDRLYMDVRFVGLPSGKGYFEFPTKVYRNRVRGDGQGYVPDRPLTWPVLEDALAEAVLSRVLLQRCPVDQ